MLKVVVGLACSALIIVSCAAEEDGSGSTDVEVGQPATSGPEESGAQDAGSFGSLGQVCGPGEATVEPSEAGKGADKLFIGVRNDRGSDIRPGLNKELWDTAVGFSEWCNAAGGVGGLQIELVDLDARVLQVDQAMATGCTDAFVMVGGAWAQDNLAFGTTDDTNFDGCGQVDFSAWNVSKEFSGHPRNVNAVPNPSDVKSAVPFEMLVEFEPEAMQKLVIVYGNLPSIDDNRLQNIEVLDTLDDIDLIDSIVYDSIGTQDWNVVAQQVKTSGATAVHFLGEPNGFARLSQKLKEQNWEGIYFSEVNNTDPLSVETAGPDAVEGRFTRSGVKPLSEGDEWPEVAQYLEIMDGVDGAKIAAAGLQGFSAWLLFADSANRCSAENDGLITRDCLVETARDNQSWDGGGLHTAVNLSEGEPLTCNVLTKIEGGEFVRAFPEIGSEQADEDGFYCSDTPLVELSQG